MLSNKRLDFLPSMNRRVIPNHHQRPRYLLQQLPQEIDHLLTGQIALIQLHPQLDPMRFGGDQQGANQVRPLVMLQTGANRRRLAAWRPSALEGTDQIFATFIEENKGRSQALPLFLSTASDTVSNKQSPFRRVGKLGVAAFGNSNSFGATNARCHSGHNRF